MKGIYSFKGFFTKRNYIMGDKDTEKAGAKKCNHHSCDNAHSPHSSNTTTPQQAQQAVILNHDNKSGGVVPKWILEIIIGIIIVFCSWTFKNYTQTKVWEAQHAAKSDAYFEVTKENSVRIDELRLKMAKIKAD